MRPLLTLSVLFLVAATAVQGAPSKSKPMTNPLLQEWKTPYGAPPFGDIKPEHFSPAFDEAMARQQQEIAAVAANPAAPTFANTIEGLENTGLLLSKVNGVFSNLIGAETNDALQAVNREMSPKLSAHRDDIAMNAALFARVKAVYDQRASLKLDAEQKTLLERTYRNFVRGGAQLDEAGKTRLRAINQDLSKLGVTFGDRLLQEMNGYRLVIDQPADLAGLPDRVVAGAAEDAKKAGLDGKWVFTLQAPSIWPFMQYADNRELRRQIFTAYTTRCDHGDAKDTKETLAQIAALRAEKARLLGYGTWADFVLDENMAKTPDQVYALLERLWVPAKEVAAREDAALQAAAKADGKDFTIQPWDWFYYTEKVRKAKYDLDETALRPYFPLDQVREGAFDTAHRLYGVTFKEVKNVPVYNPEVRAFEVKDGDGKLLALFYTDYFPRPGKRVGAWTSRYRDQFVMNGKDTRPIVVNVCNFSRPAGDAPAQLSLEETETLFHEFGHALNSILSDIHYRSLASTPRDFVELPSQIMENWATQPEVMNRYAKHWKTGEVIPAALVEKIKASRKFNQGFATVEYLGASLLDMDWHTQATTSPMDPATFERISLARMGMPPYIVPRYRSTYFQHIFGPGGGYSSGYYSYIWAEVLDADAFAYFKQKGIFDPATARSFRDNVLSRGGTEEAMVLYKRFRGQDPSVEPLLERRGLKPEAAPSAAAVGAP
jgi:peptidyl-dipeptidase Dcp